MTNQVVDPGLLDWRVSITDKDGRPSPQFQRAWNTSRNNQALIGFITFGNGAPTSVNPQDGAEYVDVSTSPYTLYVGQGGNWNILSPVGGNPTALAGPTAQAGIASTFMRSDAAPAVQEGSSTQLGIVQADGVTITAAGGTITAATATGTTLGVVKPDGTTVTINLGVLSVPLATVLQPGLVEPDGTTIVVSGGHISVPIATVGTPGLAQPDGTTITIAGGVISAVGGGSGGVGGVLPLVTGDLPGPVLIADSLGQCIGVPL